MSTRRQFWFGAIVLLALTDCLGAADSPAGTARGSLEFVRLASVKDLEAYAKNSASVQPQARTQQQFSSAVASYQPRLATMRVWLFPEKLEGERLASIRKTILEKRMGTDELQNAGMEFSLYTFVFAKGTTQPALAQVESFNLIAIKGKELRQSFSWATPEAFSKFEAPKLPGEGGSSGAEIGQLRFAVKSQQDTSGSTFWFYRWDIEVDAPVYFSTL